MDDSAENMEAMSPEPRSPSPDIIEIPVPPRPPPELIELESDPESTSPSTGTETETETSPTISVLETNYQFPLEAFQPIAQNDWSWFHGTFQVIPQSILKSWYQEVSKSVYSDAQQTFLNLALDICLLDNNHYETIGIEKLTSKEIRRVRKATKDQREFRMNKAVESRPDIEDTVRETMESQTSLLQLCLIGPKRPRGCPRRTEWAPNNCTMPLGVFRSILRMRLNSQGKILNLSEEALRVRYVEFMALMADGYKNRNFQVLHAVFNAFGPNLDDCPIRVYYILQETKLLRTDLRLPHFGSSSKEIFKELNEDFRTKKKGNTIASTPNAKPLKRLSKSCGQAAKQNKKVSNSPPAISSSPRPNTISSSTSTASPLPRSSPSTAVPRERESLEEHLPQWRSNVGEVLNVFGLPLLTQAGYRETLERHDAYLLRGNSSMDSMFMKGMFAGASVVVRSYEEHSERTISSSSTSSQQENIAGVQRQSQSTNQIFPIPTQIGAGGSATAGNAGMIGTSSSFLQTNRPYPVGADPTRLHQHNIRQQSLGSWNYQTVPPIGPRPPYLSPAQIHPPLPSPSGNGWLPPLPPGIQYPFFYGNSNSSTPARYPVSGYYWPRP